MILRFKLAQTIPVGPLGVGVNVHLDDTVLDGGGDLFVGGAGATVHDKEEGLVVVAAELLLGVGLVLSETSRAGG